jgi:hypothetical protein
VALSVAAVAVRGRWVKHTYPGSSPLPKRDPPPDNRWQHGDIVDAEQLAKEGWAGLLAQSAARPSGKILCLFRDELGVRNAQPIPPARRVDEPPAPPTGLRT